MSVEERLAKIYILSKVFETVKQSCFVGCPPTKELVDIFAKIGNKSNDSQSRIHCYKALTRVMKAGAQNVSAVIPDLVKNYAKTAEKLMSSSSSQATDADWQIKLQCVKGLKLLV